MGSTPAISLMPILISVQGGADAAVTFVGARYSERETVLSDLARRGIPVKTYGREWSRHPWDIARTRRWRSSGLPGGDLPRAAYCR